MDHLFPIFCLIIAGSYAVFLGALGIVLIFIAQRQCFNYEKCQSWHRSQGVVFENGMTTDLTSHGRISYIPVVQYVFLANHHMVQSCKIGFGRPQQYSRRKKAQQILDSYPPGCKVNVFFNPHNPEETVLEGSIYNPKQCLILGTIFILLMVLLLSLIAAWCINQKNDVVFHLLNISSWVWIM